MKAKTELFLWQMLWFGSMTFRPTYRNLDQSFEGWAYSNGLLAQVHRLEAKGLIESKLDARTGKRLHRLTEAGLKVAVGERDPKVAWAMPWDEKWRLFLFDIPEKQSARRKKLTRALSAAGCGCMQGSVWVSPMPPPSLLKLIEADETDCSRLILLEADSKGNATDKRMVAAAWNFRAINEAYQIYLDLLKAFDDVQSNPSREALAEWSSSEYFAWRKALAMDPLLPSKLLPSGYLGKTALQKRQQLRPKLEGIAESR